MIVHEPTLTREAGEICIAARFEVQKPLPYMPKELWYRFPAEYEPRLSARADGFAATALFVAMYAGEDLTVRGPISPKLAYGLGEFRNIFHAWLPNIYRMVEIRFDQLAEPPRINGKSAVAAAFSGGIDSFYTLQAQLPANQPIPDARLTHGLFVHGLDLRLDDRANYRATASHYAGLFEGLGIELMVGSTNAYQFSEFRVNWRYFYGPPLVGAALLMSPFLRRFYIPSGLTYRGLRPNGNTPLTDHLLSTETLDIVHHGASTERFDKVAALTDWPATYHNIRVCSDKRRMQVVQNCSACDKCYRTIASLILLNASSKYNNFASKLTLGSYLKWGTVYLNLRYVRDLRRRALKSGRVGMALGMQIAIILARSREFLTNLFKRMISQEQLYQIKRRIYHPETQEVDIES